MGINRDIFDELFVLELANNHWGSLERAKRIVDDFAHVVRYNNVRAAIKLQFRDVDTFIHDDFKGRQDVRYIKKTLDTKLSRPEFAEIVAYIKKSGCIAMATPFDEKSVDMCVEFDMPMIKIASSDINDWVLIEKIATTKRPVIASTGGSSIKDCDDLVTFFERRNIPLAVNHCVSLYPSEDNELELNQIDFLRDRYPGVTIGYSTHEYHDWHSSMLISYAKGARTWERHIDIDADGIPVSKYCSLPDQADEWFRAFHKAKEMCGAPGTSKRIPSQREVEYLDALVRGVYAKRDLPAGHELADSDLLLAVPLLKGQLSCRELIAGEKLIKAVTSGQPIMIDHLDNPYSRNPALRRRIEARGMAATEIPNPLPATS
uniref:N,N'-diacetyllegionaminic acid synthase n=1 Tax=uncultured organism TaxID=155900 RepID=A0A7L9QC07_9ZZZZ|nr:N,N'-diacetyllegionaminic acid synthase [uncultured organism]